MEDDKSLWKLVLILEEPARSTSSSLSLAGFSFLLINSTTSSTSFFAKVSCLMDCLLGKKLELAKVTGAEGCLAGACMG